MSVQLLKQLQKLKKERKEINTLDISSDSELYKRLQELEKEISQLESLTSPNIVESSEFANSEDIEIILGCERR